MTLLPQFQTDDKSFGLMQTAWATHINPVISRPQNNSVILKRVILVTGDNIINHTLNKELTGWRIVRIRAAATIYDKQDSNNTPTVNLVLNTSANVTIDLEVF